METRCQRKGNSVIWVDVNGSYVSATASTPAFLFGIVIDITDRKRVQEELRRSEAFLTEGQRISQTGSWAWNVATGEVSWSPEHFRIFGLDPERAKPSYSVFIERVHPEDRPLVERTIERVNRERGE